VQRMVVITTSQEAARAFTDMDNGLILVTSAKVVSLILMKGALVGPPNEFPMCLTLLQHILLVSCQRTDLREERILTYNDNEFTDDKR